MAKKNKIFSGQTLSDKERKQIEEQLKRSRERDIKAQKESNARRKKRNEAARIKRTGKRLDKIRPYVGGATEGREAHERYKAIMDNIRKSDRDDVRGMDYNDVFVAADALIDDTTDYWSAEEFEDYIMKYLSALLD